MSGWPSGLRRCVQVAVHFCGRGFESHFWHKIFLGKINIFVGWLYPLKCPPHGSRVAQWKRAGPITQRSVDRNYALLNVFFKNWKSTIFWPKICIHLFWRSKFFTAQCSWTVTLRKKNFYTQNQSQRVSVTIVHWYLIILKCFAGRFLS